MKCHSPAGYTCLCYYGREWISNVTTSSSTMQTLPSHVHNRTDRLLMHNTNIPTLCGSFSYIKTLQSLDLRGIKIITICVSFAKKLRGQEMKSKTVLGLMNLKEIWLSDNRFHCDCDMAWMIGWLNNFTTPLGEHVIADYEELKCYSGMMVGQAIYKLDKVKMGCFPPKLTLWQKISIGIAAGMAGVTIVALTTLVIKRSRDVKFFFYYYFKWCTCCGVPRDDKNETLDDAYLSFR